MQIRPIENEADYRRAFKEIEPYFENPPSKDDPARDVVDAMISVIEAYERRHFPLLDNATAVDALRFVMEQQELTAKDLAPCIGSTEWVGEVLAGKRPLTLSMIRRLYEVFDIPVEVSDPSLRRTAALAPTASRAKTSGRVPLHYGRDPQTCVCRSDVDEDRPTGGAVLVSFSGQFPCRLTLIRLSTGRFSKTYADVFRAINS